MEWAKGKIWGIAASAAVSVTISAIGVFASLFIQSAQMDVRMLQLEKTQERHKAAREKGFSALAGKSDDHEQRLVRLETSFSLIQRTLDEMKSDLKQLLVVKK